MTNKQAIPWKRISVEAAAIVVSILLAFAIDAWWDERKDRLEEQEILRSLKTDFEANREQAKDVILLHDDALNFAATLMKLTDDELLSLSAEEVQEQMRYLAYPKTFDAVRGSIDALTSAGKLEILQDRELRAAITNFVNILEDAQEDREYMFEWAMIVWQEVAREGGPYWAGNRGFTLEECKAEPASRGCYQSISMAYLPLATPEDLLRLRNNRTLMGYVNRSHENSARYAAEIQDAQAQIDIILELLD